MQNIIKDKKIIIIGSVFLVLIFCLCVCFIFSAYKFYSKSDKKEIVDLPDEGNISIGLDRQEYKLGENIDIYIKRNVSEPLYVNPLIGLYGVQKYDQTRDLWLTIEIDLCDCLNNFCSYEDESYILIENSTKKYTWDQKNYNCEKAEYEEILKGKYRIVVYYTDSEKEETKNSYSKEFSIN